MTVNTWVRKQNKTKKVVTVATTTTTKRKEKIGTNRKKTCLFLLQASRFPLVPPMRKSNEESAGQTETQFVEFQPQVHSIVYRMG